MDVEPLLLLLLLLLFYFSDKLITKEHILRSEVLTAVLLKIEVFWDVMLHQLVD